MHKEPSDPCGRLFYDEACDQNEARRSIVDRPYE